tara:strand:- start:139 stop:375 length:237 start_codon:yes stop_codon:yes gene_type:complete
MKLKRIHLRRIILKEIEKMKEDVLMPSHDEFVTTSKKTSQCDVCGMTVCNDETTCEECEESIADGENSCLDSDDGDLQ